MKKALSLILALVLCLSLCACGSKLDGEASNESEAPVATESLKYTEIAITVDNWDTYFEVVRKEEWITDSFGELIRFVVIYNLAVKEEYVSRLTKIEETEITIDPAIEYTTYKCQVDFNAKTYTVGDPVTYVSCYTAQVGTYSVAALQGQGFNGVVLGHSAAEKDGSLQYVMVIEKVEMSRIKGSICLLDE